MRKQVEVTRSRAFVVERLEIVGHDLIERRLLGSKARKFADNRARSDKSKG